MKLGVGTKVTISSLIGVVCLGLATRKVDWGEVGAALHGFDRGWLLVAVIISLLIQVLRALRWQVELSPLKRLAFPMVWQVVAVAYMMINVLPFRIGEPVRPLLMSWRSGLKVSAIVGNWVFEKMMDAAAIVVFVHLALVTADFPEWAHHASKASLTAFLVLLGIVVTFWLRGEKFFDATIGKWLSPQAREKSLHVLRNARSGLGILPNRRLVALVFVLTLALWSLPVLSSYVLIRGFDLDIPASAALVVFVAISIGTALPSPPGMFGVMQIASVVALGFFGVPKSQALAYGILLNALQFLTLVAQGLLAMPFVGTSMGEMTRAAVGCEQQEALKSP
jgi:uncharacterized protein (TIRG00374 family)